MPRVLPSTRDSQVCDLLVTGVELSDLLTDLEQAVPPDCKFTLLTKRYTHNQVCRARLAVHLHRIGIPRDVVDFYLEGCADLDWAFTNPTPISLVLSVADDGWHGWLTDDDDPALVELPANPFVFPLKGYSRDITDALTRIRRLRSALPLLRRNRHLPITTALRYAPVSILQ